MYCALLYLADERFSSSIVDDDGFVLRRHPAAAHLEFLRAHPVAAAPQKFVEFAERYRALTIYVGRSSGKVGEPDFVLEQLRNACDRSLYKIGATIAVLLDDNRPTWREELRTILTDSVELLTTLI